jgi:glutamate-5-semialdehyde dehydrogenase
MNAASTSLTESAAASDVLTTLPPGLTLPYGGNRLARVPDAVAAAFRPGDHLVVVQTTGDVLHIPAA